MENLKIIDNVTAEEMERKEIYNNLLLLYGNNANVEVRMLRTTQGTISGYYTDFHKLVEDVYPFNGINNIFVTLNQVKPDVMARSYNHLNAYSKITTTDGEIGKLTHFLLDIDAKRPAGVSATDAEKKEACKVAVDVKKFLVKEIGFCDCVVFDSGNGYHLIFAIDLPNNDEVKNLLRNALKVLDRMFSNDKAEVDVTTFNASRITKLYGTIACKGDSTDERPHRWANRIYTPEVIEKVSMEKIEELVAYLPQPPEPAVRNGFTGDTKNINFDMDEFLTKHGIEVLTKKPYGDSTMWVLKECPWNHVHDNGSAFIIQFPNGGIHAKCHHNSCKNETWQTLQDKLEPGWRNKNIKEGKPATKKDEDEKETQAEILINIASTMELFKTPTGECYATTDAEQCSRTFKIKSNDFKLWLTKEFYDLKGRPPAADSIAQALGVLESKALFEGEEKRLYLRVAKFNDSIFFDLANKKGQIIEIAHEGYRLANNPPNIFRRTANMSEQVKPTGNSEGIKLLCKHIRNKTRDDLILMLVAVIASFIPDIAHPVVIISGEKGAAKTTTMRMLRKVIDPAGRDLVGMPKAERDLAIILSNNYMPSFDNIDSISANQSDVLCMVSTGGGISQRKLYTDSDEVFLEFKHCVFMNGINVGAKRPDLLDRSIIIELDRIAEEEREEELALWETFSDDLPVIMGGIFSILSKAMRIHPTINLDRLPRMADFARWGYSIAEAMEGYDGEDFLRAYYKNIDYSNECTINEDPTAATIVVFMRNQSSWQGYISNLYRKLQEVAASECIDIKAYRWPKAAHILTRRLKEVRSNLEKVGITFDTSHDGGGTKIIITNACCAKEDNDRQPRKREIAQQNSENQLGKIFGKVS